MCGPLAPTQRALVTGAPEPKAAKANGPAPDARPPDGSFHRSTAPLVTGPPEPKAAKAKARHETSYKDMAVYALQQVDVGREQPAWCLCQGRG